MHYRILVLSALFTLPACGKDSGDTSAEGSSGGGSSGTTQTDTPTGTSTGGTSTGSIDDPTTMVDDSTTTTGVDPSTSSSTTALPSSTDAESSSGGSSTGADCAKCSEIIGGADPATLCPESQALAKAFQDCICKECDVECAETCMNGADPEAACTACGQAAAFGACGEAFNACAADA